MVRHGAVSEWKTRFGQLNVATRYMRLEFLNMAESVAIYQVIRNEYVLYMFRVWQ